MLIAFVVLYLLVTMLPFAGVAPVLGPALDYRRRTRRDAPPDTRPDHRSGEM